MVKPKVYGKVLSTYIYIKSNNGEPAEINATEMAEIDKAVLLATTDLDPHTVDELQKAFDLRSKIEIAEIKKRGYKVKVLRRWNNLYSDPASYKWKQGTAESLAKYN